MGILHDAIIYVKDERTGKEGFLTKHESMYAMLPNKRILRHPDYSERHDSIKFGESIDQVK